MNNRELLIQQRVIMVEKDFNKTYHEVIGDLNSNYIALYSLIDDQTDVLKKKKDKTSGNLLKLSFKLRVEWKVRLFVGHGKRFICDSNVYDGNSGKLIH